MAEVSSCRKSMYPVQFLGVGGVSAPILERGNPFLGFDAILGLSPSCDTGARRSREMTVQVVKMVGMIEGCLS
jgi:hypothetical protein